MPSQQASRQRASIYLITVPQEQHSTAQSARTKPQSKYVPIRVRRRKQTELVDNLHSTLSSKSERRYRNLPGLYNHSHSTGVMREGFACSFELNNNMQHCSFSPSFLCNSCMHAASELLSWSMELLAFASRQFAPKVVDLSLSKKKIRKKSASPYGGISCVHPVCFM